MTAIKKGIYAHRIRTAVRRTELALGLPTGSIETSIYGFALPIPVGDPAFRPAARQLHAELVRAHVTA